MSNLQYNYQRENIQDLDNINQVIGDKISIHKDYILDGDLESKEDLKSAFIDFMLEMRTQNNLLHLAIQRASKTNKLLINDAEKTDEFKLELLKIRY